MNRQLGLALAVLLVVTGCRSGDHAAADHQEPPAASTSEGSTLIAELSPTQGNSAAGVVSFTETGDGILIAAHVTGLEPGEHGFHIHENGDCSAPDGSSAGGHFNPDGTPHGAPTNPTESRHVGDLGNIVADASGTAHREATDAVIAFTGSRSILGKAVIVHSGADDLTTQPTGAAGSRLACGVIAAKE